MNEIKVVKVKTKPKMYFGKHVQDAIVNFQNTEDKKVKDDIYNEEIQPAFEKLSESLIYIYRFNQNNVNVEELKNDCVSFLYETIHKWKPEKGTKAFSYFNVVAKHWLIIRARQNTKRFRRNISYQTETLSAHDKNILANHQVIPSPDTVMIKALVHDDIMKVLHKIQKKVKNSNEKVCIKAIIQLFETIDDLDMLNKRAVFVYLRDISGLNSKKLSTAMSSIRKHYKYLVKDKDGTHLFFGS
jgi:hypothetical protein